MSAAMEPPYEQLPATAIPAEDQQGMSPSTVVAAAATDPSVNGVVALQQDGVGEMESGAMGSEVAVRTMTVAMATSSPGGQPGWTQQEAAMVAQAAQAREAYADATTTGYEGFQNAAQASWSVTSTRRSVPVWMQRLGAFFQEMGARQQSGPLWTPSPMGTPPPAGRRAMGSPETDPGPRGRSEDGGQSMLWTREQQEQLRRMEQRAPLLYGRAAPQERHDGSSGGSTYEAVQDEVRKQLRGVVEQLEESRREAGDLRREMERLQKERTMKPPEGPPVAYGGVSCRPSPDDAEQVVTIAGTTLSCRSFYVGGTTLSSRSFYIGGTALPSRSFYIDGTTLSSKSLYRDGTTCPSRIFYDNDSRSRIFYVGGTTYASKSLYLSRRRR